MNEFMVIDVMNEAMIETLKSKNENCDLNLKIKEALKDEALFFRIDKKNAYEILKRVGVKQEQFDAKEFDKKDAEFFRFHNPNIGKDTDEHYDGR